MQRFSPISYPWDRYSAKIAERGFSSCGMSSWAAGVEEVRSSIDCAISTLSGELCSGVPSRRTAVFAAEGRSKVMVADEPESTGVKLIFVMRPQKEKKLWSSDSLVCGEMLVTWMEAMIISCSSFG